MGCGKTVEINNKNKGMGFFKKTGILLKKLINKSITAVKKGTVKISTCVWVCGKRSVKKIQNTIYLFFYKTPFHLV